MPINAAGTTTVPAHHNSDGRDETPNERYDRNWNELLQEFRVLQTGTQILAGFLLTLPFQQRFTELSNTEHSWYVVLVALAAAIAVLALAPVTVHRLVFRQGAKRQLVALSSGILILCLAAASLLFVGILVFVFAFVVSPSASGWAGAAGLVLVVVTWAVVPPLVRRARRREELTRASQ